MPRAERLLDVGDAVLVAFATDLRRLRDSAGSPPYRELARRAHYSAGTLSDAAGGRKLPTLPVTLAYVQACGGDTTQWEQRWHAVTTELSGNARANEDGTADITDTTQRSPYVGLGAFQPGDMDRFHGRDALAEELVRRIREQRFLAVFGASGAGKSSLLRAGLIARIRQQGSNGRQPMRVALFTPGPRPIEECAIAVATQLDQSPTELNAELRADPNALHLRIRQAFDKGFDHGDGADLVLVVDQFEEVFTLCQDAGERVAFIATLLAAARAANSRTRVVLGVRTDFYTQCANHPDLVEALQDAQLLVGPMSTDELRAAITQPAVQAGYMLESALLATVLAKADGRPGVLPLVSHALVETWRRRRGTTLTLSGYQAAGGIEHAIARTAEAVYAEFDPAQQRIAKDMFLRMTAVGADAKRRIRRRELESDDPNVQIVLERLTKARLVLVDGATVEITHEALLRSWPRLIEWQGADSDGLLVHRQLAEATETWESLHYDDGALYRGTRLAVAREWLPHHEHGLTRRERAFLNASMATDDRERAAVTRRTVQLRWLAVTLAVLLVLSGVLAGAAEAQWHNADAQRADAVSRQLAADASAANAPDVAMLLAIAAYHQAPTVEASSALLSAQSQYSVTRLVGHTNLVAGVAFSPDGHLLATAGVEGTVKLWDGHSHRLLSTLTVGGHPINIAISADEHTLAVADQDGSVTLWDLGGGRRVATLATSASAVYGLQFSSDGQTLVVCTGNYATELWSVPARRLLGQFPAPAATVHAAVLSPDGQLLATGDDSGEVQIWQPADPRAPIVTLPSSTGALSQLAFSPNGQQLGAITDSGAVTLWRTDTWQRVATFGAAATNSVDRSLKSIAFSPNGQTLVTAGENDIKLWDTATQALLASLPVDSGRLSLPVSVFSPDGRTLATNDGDDTLLWQLPGPALLANPASSVQSVAYAPNGALLAAGSQNGTVQLWSTRGQTLLGTLTAHSGQIEDVAFSPNSQLLAVAYQKAPLQLWNVATRQVVATLHRPGVASDAQNSVAFSPDGTTLAVADTDGTIALWNVAGQRLDRTLNAGAGIAIYVRFSADGGTLASVTYAPVGRVQVWRLPSYQLVQSFPNAAAVSDIALTPDGGTVAIACDDGTVQLWSTTQDKLVGTLTPATEPFAVTFGPDGTTLATAGAGYAIQLWNVASQTVTATLSGAGGDVYALAFSPDGHTLASVGSDYAARLWRLDPDQVSSQLCAILGKVTPARWAHLLPTLPYQPVCS